MPESGQTIISNTIESIRHSLSHILAMAVLDMFPEAKLAIGPAIEHGFYYDFELPRTLIPEDLPLLEERMRAIITQGLPFERGELPRDQALELFSTLNQLYKVELINDLPIDETISFYKTGERFLDLCRGPHVASTKDIPNSFTLTKISGAYWKGDEKNTMLQRIYGLAFQTKEELEAYLQLLEEARLRDHRRLGKELDLFTFSDLVGPGLPLWTFKGSVIRRELERFIVDEELKRGYQHVYTPDLAKKELYEKSGHYPYYKDTMYPLIQVDNDELLLRPMTCPHHFQLFSYKKRSYRELPMRIAELAKLYRYEKSGELTGLIRVRSFCLADAHIICRYGQASSEIHRALDLIEYLCEVFGISKGTDYSYRLSLGDRDDEKKYYKNDAAWDAGEALLRKVLQERDVPFTEANAEAAFYGPKIDIQMKNVVGKEDTAFTVQYDFCMPDRFELLCTNEQGEDEKTVVIHRSSVGAIERIIGFLIEKYAGKFPVWLAPVQASIIPISDKQLDYATTVQQQLATAGIRAEIDDRSERMQAKIRDAQGQQIPYMLVVGDREKEEGTVAPRRRDGEKLETMKIADFSALVVDEIEKKVRW